MALTVTVTDNGVSGNRRQKYGTITFDSSYPSDGEAFLASTLGLVEIDSIVFNGVDGYVFEYDKANDKILARVSGTTGAPLDDEGNATDMSAVSVDFVATGR